MVTVGTISFYRNGIIYRLCCVPISFRYILGPHLGNIAFIAIESTPNKQGKLDEELHLRNHFSSFPILSFCGEGKGGKLRIDTFAKTREISDKGPVAVLSRRIEYEDVTSINKNIFGLRTIMFA